jgi:hypothetical protein
MLPGRAPTGGEHPWPHCYPIPVPLSRFFKEHDFNRAKLKSDLRCKDGRNAKLLKIHERKESVVIENYFVCAISVGRRIYPNPCFVTVTDTGCRSPGIVTSLQY